MNALFVYGLLKPGQRLFHVAEPFVVRSAAASVRGRLYDVGVPAARFDEDGNIDGVVFWLDEFRLDEALRILDELEDEGTEYRRVVIGVRADGDRNLDAYAYEYLLEVRPDSDVGRTWPD